MTTYCLLFCNGHIYIQNEDSILEFTGRDVVHVAKNPTGSIRLQTVNKKLVAADLLWDPNFNTLTDKNEIGPYHEIQNGGFVKSWLDISFKLGLGTKTSLIQQDFQEKPVHEHLRDEKYSTFFNAGLMAVDNGYDYGVMINAFTLEVFTFLTINEHLKEILELCEFGLTISAKEILKMMGRQKTGEFFVQREEYY